MGPRSLISQSDIDTSMSCRTLSLAIDTGAAIKIIYENAFGTLTRKVISPCAVVAKWPDCCWSDVLQSPNFRKSTLRVISKKRLVLSLHSSMWPLHLHSPWMDYGPGSNETSWVGNKPDLKCSHVPGSYHKGYGWVDLLGTVIAAESSVESHYISLACLGHASVATYLVQWLAYSLSDHQRSSCYS